MGMGRSFVALLDDVNSIYINPAGLASIGRWQVSSMQGKLIEEFNYFTIGGVYPIPKYGNFGLGILSSTVGGAPPTKVAPDSDPSDLVYTIDPSLTDINYYNNAFLLTYASKFDRVLSIPQLKFIADPVQSRAAWLKDVNFGANFKIFNVGLSGGGLTQSTGTGTEIDFGIQGNTQYNWLSYGAVMQDLLPASWGGKLVFPNNWEESYPATFKAGLAANILGEEKSLRSFMKQKVKVLLDGSLEPMRPAVPTLFKLGTEWQPIDPLYIRLGFDQAMVGSKLANNLTAGVGVDFVGFRFDYGYHQFEGAPGIANHFFSLTYGVFPPAVEKKEYITIIKPIDNLITYETNVTVMGKMHPDVGSAKVNKSWIKISPVGSFEVYSPLEIGKNTLWVMAYDKRGLILESKRRRVLRLISYPDVLPNYWVYDQVNHIGTLGIIKGYPDGKFKPEGNITRAELATLLVRTKMGTQAAIAETRPVMLFKDVPVKHWAYTFITKASKAEIVKGYPDGTFKPSDNITRAEGLAMIARFGGVTEEVYANIFRDVDATHWAAKIIAGAFKEGMLLFLRGKPFEPNKKLTRAEAVEILYRSRPVKKLTADLFNFDLGYGTAPPK